MKFRELLQELSIEAAPEDHHHSRLGWVNIDCPNCGTGTQNFHLGYNEAFGYLNCWRCGKQDLYRILETITGKPIGEISKLLTNIDRMKPKEKKRGGVLKEPWGISPMGNPHYRYLHERGFDALYLSKLWELEGIELHPRLPWRIYIPIIYQGQTVSWTTRAIGEGPNIERYISAAPDEEIVNHKTLLYGEDYARHSIIIHEGPTDVWATGPGAVGTLGTAYTPEQIKKMARYSKRAVCFDNERGARERAERLADMLSMYPGETFNIQLDSKDAATATQKERRRLRRMVLE